MDGQQARTQLQHPCLQRLDPPEETPKADPDARKQRHFI